jgi:outer membrane receptor protein involved in Fe transport
MGGTIKVITNSARLNTFEGSVDVGVSGTQGAGANPNVSGMLNLPLVADKVALRIVATDKYTSGWIDRIVVNPFPLPTNNGCTPTLLQGCNAGNIVGSPIAKEYSGVNWTRLKGARASLFIQATDQLTIDMGVFWQQLKAGGYSQYDAESGITPIGGQLAHYQAFDESEPFGDTFELYHLTIGYDFGFAKLTSATGYWERTEDQNQDESQATQNILFLSAFVPAIANETDQSHQISQELRLASEGDSRFQWIGGLFYARLLSDYNFTQINPSLCYFAVGGCAADPAGIAGLWRNPYTIDQYAVFGESSYKFTDTLKLTVGARYYDFSNRLNYVGDGFLNPTGNANPYTGSVSSRNSGVNPKVNLSYMPDDSLTLYSTIEKGFRPGGVNLPVPVSGAYSCLSSLHAIGLDSPILQ